MNDAFILFVGRFAFNHPGSRHDFIYELDVSGKLVFSRPNRVQWMSKTFSAWLSPQHQQQRVECYSKADKVREVQNVLIKYMWSGHTQDEQSKKGYGSRLQSKATCFY